MTDPSMSTYVLTYTFSEPLNALVKLCYYEGANLCPSSFYSKDYAHAQGFDRLERYCVYIIESGVTVFCILDLLNFSINPLV